MKQFIVMCATLPIMLGLIIQCCLTQINFSHVSAAKQIVAQQEAVAKENGCFTNTQSIAEILECNEEEITVNAVMTPKYKQSTYSKEDLITIHVEAPVKKLMVPTLIGGANNSGIMRISDSFASEKLRMN